MTYLLISWGRGQRENVTDEEVDDRAPTDEGLASVDRVIEGLHVAPDPASHSDLVA